MFQPKFIYTPNLVHRLATVERLYGQLLGERLIPSLILKLIQEHQVLATHYSTSIEGNPLTHREVTNIVLGDTIPTSKSEQEVKNYFQAINHISIEAKKKQPLSIKLILKLHQLVMAEIKAKKPGQFRNSMVIVGHQGLHGLVVKHQPPAHTQAEISKQIQELFDYINRSNQTNALIQAGLLHHRVAYIHPFYDGNGRVTRLLTTYYLLLHDYEVTKYFILDDYYDIDRLQYSDKLHSADMGDQTAWLEYFLEGIEHSLRAAHERIKELSGQYIESVKGDKRVLVTPREEDVLQVVINLKQIKTSDIVKRLNVSRQQAHALLRNLVDKGILEKTGITKSSFYQLKKPVK